MQHDEVIWQLIGYNFCSFKINKQHFCKNEYNVTGLCNRQSCPLANSQYATVREYKGVCYLLMKTIERAHSPSQLWEKVKLSSNLEKAHSQIESQLEYWPEFLKAKCKLRTTRMMQVLSKKRKLILNSFDHSELSAFKQKSERREKTREIKAEAAARLDQSIERELLARLKDGLYGDIYNFPAKNFEKVIQEKKGGQVMRESQVQEQEGEESEEEEEEEQEQEFIEDEYEESENEEEEEEEFEFEESDKEDIEDQWKVVLEEPRTKKAKGPTVEIEYEHEDVSTDRRAQHVYQIKK